MKKEGWRGIKIGNRVIYWEGIVGLNERWWDFELRIGEREKVVELIGIDGNVGRKKKE